MPSGFLPSLVNGAVVMMMMMIILIMITSNYGK